MASAPEQPGAAGNRGLHTARSVIHTMINHAACPVPGYDAVRREPVEFGIPSACRQYPMSPVAGAVALRVDAPRPGGMMGAPGAALSSDCSASPSSPPSSSFLRNRPWMCWLPCSTQYIRSRWCSSEYPRGLVVYVGICHRLAGPRGAADAVAAHPVTGTASLSVPSFAVGTRRNRQGNRYALPVHDRSRIARPSGQHRGGGDMAGIQLLPR